MAGERVGEEVRIGANPRWASRSRVRRTTGGMSGIDPGREDVASAGSAIVSHARARGARVRIPAATRFFGGAGLWRTDRRKWDQKSNAVLPMCFRYPLEAGD